MPNSSDMRRAVEQAGQVVRGWPRWMQPFGALPPKAPVTTPRPQAPSEPTPSSSDHGRL